MFYRSELDMNAAFQNGRYRMGLLNNSLTFLGPYSYGLELSELSDYRQKMNKRTLVIFSCSGCDQLFQAAQSPFVESASGHFNCFDCAAPVHQWSAHYDYTTWTRYVDEMINAPPIQANLQQTH